MSLKFAHTGNSDRVDLTNTGTDPIVGTIYMWVLNFALVAATKYFTKGPAAGGNLEFGCGNGTAHRLQFGIDYTTTDVNAVSLDNVLILNTPQFVSATFNGTVSVPRLYVGTHNKAPHEVPGYTAQTAGVGTRVTDSGAIAKIGNRSTHTNSPSAYIELVNFIDGVPLTPNEIVDHWEEARQHPLSKYFSYLGETGNGTQYDFTGKGNNGTTSGCIVGPRIFLPQRASRRVFGEPAAAPTFNAAWGAAANTMIHPGAIAA